VAAVLLVTVAGDATAPTFGPPLYSGEPLVVRGATPDEIVLSWGPTAGDLARGIFTARRMSLDEAAGQVIVALFYGQDPAGVEALVRTYHLGGVAFGGGNVGSSALTQEMTAAAQRGGEGRDWPVIVATDQEGGPVARLKNVIPALPAFLASGATRDKSVVRSAFMGEGADMLALGFNMDFAPVADLTVGLADPIIRTRSAGDDPADVSATVIAASNGLLGAGVIPTVKHFPGHGGVTVDSHLDLPVQTASIEALESYDLVPFRSAVEAGVPVVMMSHVAVAAWGGTPSSLDPAAYAYLRDDLGFRGVVVTDSLSMAAVQGRGEGGPAVAALNAGADIVLMPSNTAAAHAEIVAAVESGLLSRARLDEAAARVITLMRWQVGLPRGDVEGDYAHALATAGIAVTSPLCGGPLVGPTVTISGGWPEERAALAAELAARGVGIGGGTTIRLLGSPGGSGAADIVVAMDGPWGLPQSSATTYVGLFGRSAESFAALADVLTGAVAPTGRWPVALPGLTGTECRPDA
jgi:beta-glucosidase-like glycosyl hydrolase